MAPHDNSLSRAQCEALNAILEALWEIEFTPAWDREAFRRLQARAFAITADANHFRWLYSAADPSWWQDAR